MNEEQAEFEALFRETRGPLLTYLSHRAPDADAPDLLADVYLIAWRRRADLPQGDERRLWLYGVARRLLAEHHRLTRRGGAPQEPADHEVADQATEGDGRGEAVRRALDSLSDLDRELVSLTMWERLTPAQAARAVGITAGTARVRLHRARARLARHPRLVALLDSADDAETGDRGSDVGVALRPRAPGPTPVGASGGT